MPNIQISEDGGATVITIRGVSSADNTEKGDPSASFNIDGVYDLERVEVLRGPQGTLYGRNTTAGAINLISNKPVDKFEGSAAVEFGNYNSVKFDGMLNARINDVLSIRGAVNKARVASAELKANTRIGELTYQAARRTMDRNLSQSVGQARSGIAPTDFRVIGDYGQTSHELRLASTAGLWKAITFPAWTHGPFCE